jgi:hypothetical protein
MSYWDGTRWVQEEAAPSAPRPSRAANWAATAAMVVGLATVIAPLQLITAASHHGTNSGCAVSPSSADVGEAYVVSAWGLSTRTAINLWVTENGVTTGTPIGGTTDGTFALSLSSETAGVTTYTFSGPTGKNMKTYGSCSVSLY